MLEEILDYRNIQSALKQVVGNRGAAGQDGMTCEELVDWLQQNWSSWKAAILEGAYRPSAVRQVMIPKPGGGQRTLGIPCVRDRLLQQAVQQWLSPKYDPSFSRHSYGFRPGRSAHQAVIQAQAYLMEGKEWVVELDLDRFFDRVNHDKLMGTLAKEITDKRTLKLIRSFLNSGILEGGLSGTQAEGVPQGSPLSPLLSNIVLDKLDKELEGRGHDFVRYADDVSIYVQSKRAAERVKESITGFIEDELKLKVNRSKTVVSAGENSNLLGFSFFRSKGEWFIRISPKALSRVKEKIKRATQRKDPARAGEKIKKIESMVRGWVNYFRIARAGTAMDKLDQLARQRLRMGIWKHWKTPGNRRKQLRQLGLPADILRKTGLSRSGHYRAAKSLAMRMAVSNKVLRKAGYIGFLQHYNWITRQQINLF